MTATELQTYNVCSGNASLKGTGQIRHCTYNIQENETISGSMGGEAATFQNEPIGGSMGGESATFPVLHPSPPVI
jgi:hypothetical protein